MKSTKYFIPFLLIMIIFTLGGCGDSVKSYKPYKAYQKATEENTIEAYEEFIENYPDHSYVRLARNRIEAMRTLETYHNSFGYNTTNTIKKSDPNNP